MYALVTVAAPRVPTADTEVLERLPTLLNDRLNAVGILYFSGLLEAGHKPESLDRVAKSALYEVRNRKPTRDEMLEFVNHIVVEVAEKGTPVTFVDRDGHVRASKFHLLDLARSLVDHPRPTVMSPPKIVYDGDTGEVVELLGWRERREYRAPVSLDASTDSGSSRRCDELAAATPAPDEVAAGNELNASVSALGRGDPLREAALASLMGREPPGGREILAVPEVDPVDRLVEVVAGAGKALAPVGEVAARPEACRLLVAPPDRIDVHAVGFQ